MYQRLYSRPSLLKALDKWNKISEKAGVLKAVFVYRRIAYHSALRREYGDAVIIEGRTPVQVSETLEAIAEGPLKDDISAQIKNVWELAEDEAPVSNYSF